MKRYLAFYQDEEGRIQGEAFDYDTARAAWYGLIERLIDWDGMWIVPEQAHIKRDKWDFSTLGEWEYSPLREAMEEKAQHDVPGAITDREGYVYQVHDQEVEIPERPLVKWDIIHNREADIYCPPEHIVTLEMAIVVPL